MPATLEQLVKVRSSLADDLLKYLQLMIDAPDRVEVLPGYMGGHKRTALYVELDVFKRECNLPEREKPERGSLAPEAQDVGDDALYGERGAETERRVPWMQEQKELERLDSCRIVILAPPGQGKSLLIQMTARQVAQRAYHELNDQRADLDVMALPIAVTLAALAAKTIPKSATAEERLRLALLPELRMRFGDPTRAERVAAYLARYVQEHRSWLFLDALDEAEDTHELGTFFAELKNCQAHLIVTARPYGYIRQQLPFESVLEYRLAPFSLDQARAFVGKRFDTGEAQAQMNTLLTRSLSVQQMSQNPFLLTLLCWVVERHGLIGELTRTQVYDRVVRDLLGLNLNGTRMVNDSRANQWIPLLSELALALFKENAGRQPMSHDRLLEMIGQSDYRPVPLDKEGLELELDALKNLAGAQQADYLLEELRHKRLLVPLSHNYAAYVFPHRSILEFLTGYMLAGLVNKPDGKGWHARITVNGRKWSVSKFVDKKAWLPEWQEVIVFMSGQLSDPAPLLRRLYNDKPTRTNPHGDDVFRHRLALAALCLPELRSEVRQARSGLVDEITDTTFRLWREYWTDPFSRLVVRHISEVLPALGQVNGEIHDNASRRTRRVTSRVLKRATNKPLPLLEYLFDLLQHANDKVRAQAAEAVRLIGSAAVTPAFLERLSQLPQVQAAGRDILEHLADRPLESYSLWSPMPLGWQGEEHNEAMTPAMIPQLPDLLQAEDPELRGTAAAEAAKLGRVAATPVILNRLADLLSEEDEVVQRSAVQSVAVMMEYGVRFFSEQKGYKYKWVVELAEEP